MTSTQTLLLSSCLTACLVGCTWARIPDSTPLTPYAEVCVSGVCITGSASKVCVSGYGARMCWAKDVPSQGISPDNNREKHGIEVSDGSDDATGR